MNNFRDKEKNMFVVVTNNN